MHKISLTFKTAEESQFFDDWWDGPGLLEFSTEAAEHDIEVGKVEVD